jgi:hypothetical protein
MIGYIHATGRLYLIVSHLTYIANTGIGIFPSELRAKRSSIIVIVAAHRREKSRPRSVYQYDDKKDTRDLGAIERSVILFIPSIIITMMMMLLL